MATMMEKRGTCPACMGEYQLFGKDGGTVVGKHGWREVGGRQVGQYGLATHVGECFGVGFPPFEISPEGTWAYLLQLVYPHCLGQIAYLTRLEARCSVRVEEKDGERTKFVELTAENEAGAKRVTLYRRTGTVHTTRYEQVRAAKVEETEADLRRSFDVGVGLTRIALAWAPADLKDGVPQGPTVHYQNTGARVPHCGSRSYGLVTTTVETDVTCSRCVKALVVSAREAAERKALNDDADAVVALLKSGGPKTKSEIKTALGWDTKRTNRAVDQAEWPWVNGARQAARVRCVYTQSTKPNKYEAV